MKIPTALIRRFGRLRLAAAFLAALPLILLPVLGVIWLWQSRLRLHWLVALAACALAGYLLHLAVAYLERKKLPAPATGPDPLWPPSADTCWAEVERLAQQVTPEQWPLNDVEKLTLLGKNTLEQVARHYHPHRDQPLLELTVPHALLIIEMATRDLRKEIVAYIPFSHQLTAGALVRANRWRAVTKSYETWYRAGRAIISPYSAIFGELRRAVAGRIMGYGLDQMKAWLLREYVRKVGYYAIALYSGRLLLDDDPPETSPAPDSPPAPSKDVAAEAFGTGPLHILLLGRANAGKSSLVNALFGKLTAATDMLPHTTRGVNAYRLERDGEIRAFIYDPPGWDTDLFGSQALNEAVDNADLILWVTAAHRPDRQAEREQLDRIRRLSVQNPHRRPPPILGAVTHIDLLRPAREWAPPYDLNSPRGAKAEHIAACVAAVSSDLNLPTDRTIPVCLAPGRVYNVEDTLWAAILHRQDEAGRARFLRCLEERRRSESWTLMWRQLATAGRVLLDAPKRIIS